VESDASHFTIRFWFGIMQHAIFVLLEFYIGTGRQLFKCIDLHLAMRIVTSFMTMFNTEAI